MSQDEFTKLFNYMTKRFDTLEKILEEKTDTATTERIFTILDRLSKHTEITEDERLVMGHQLDRLDRWTHELADKIGHTLSI